MHLLFNDLEKPNWDQMPFPRKWFEDVLLDKTDEPHGYLKVSAFDHSTNMSSNESGLITSPGKLIYEDGGDNQVMYWLKRTFAMLEGGVFFSDTGEHKGLEDGAAAQLTEGDMPYGWAYLTAAGNYIYSTHAWVNSSNSLAIDADLVGGTATKMFPFFPTKMRFGTGGPTNITTPIDPSETKLNDLNARGPGNVAGKLNFVFISRTQHIAFTTTGFDPNNPTGYYDDFGAVFKNITVYQVTMPASVGSYPYDGKALNEAGLFCDAALTGTKNGLYEMPSGMLLTKRYFSPIQKTNTISINFQWSIVK